MTLDETKMLAVQHRLLDPDEPPSILIATFYERLNHLCNGVRNDTLHDAAIACSTRANSLLGTTSPGAAARQCGLDILSLKDKQ